MSKFTVTIAKELIPSFFKPTRDRTSFRIIKGIPEDSELVGADFNGRELILLFESSLVDINTREITPVIQSIYSHILESYEPE